MYNSFNCCKPCEVEIRRFFEQENEDSETEMGTSSGTTATQHGLVGFLQDKDLNKSAKAARVAPVCNLGILEVETDWGV